MKGKLNLLKTFFVNHGEKFIFGTFCLTALWILMGTHWIPYQNTPQQLDAIISQSNLDIQNSKYPEKDKADLEEIFAKDIVPEVDKVLDKSLDVEEHVFFKSFWSPPGGDIEPNKEPIFLTVSDLIITPGKVVLAQLKNVDDLTDEAKKNLDDSEKARKEEEEKKKNPFSLNNIGSGPGGPGEENPGGPPPGFRPPGAGDPFEGFPGGPPGFPGGPGGPGGPGMEGAVPGLAANLDIFATPFISIRGIIHRQGQIQNIARAMNLSPQVAEDYLHYLEFHLERQTAVEGDDLWAGEWERVDIQNALDILAKSPTFSTDPVSTLVQDPSLSLLLPPRIVGSWTPELVSHPKVENFELTPEEMNREIDLNVKSAKKQAELNAKLKSNTIKRRGLQQLQMKGAGDQIKKSSVAEIMKMLAETEETPMGISPAKAKELRQKLAEEISRRASASGRLTLFRYIDFNIEPGRTYRYRVRLVLYNPNFGLPVENAASQSVVEGQERTTKWSEPSEMAAVEPQTKVFVAKVDAPPANKLYEEPKVKLEIFMWHNKTGTPVHTNRLKLSLGDYIGGKAKAYLANPAEMTYEEEDVLFESNMMLIDALPFARFDLTFHADLNLIKTSSSRIENPRTLGLTSEVVVQDRYGRLIVKNNLSELTEFEYSKRQQELLDGEGGFGKLKDRKKNRSMAPDPNDPLTEGMEEYGGPPSGFMEQMRNRKNNRGMIRRR